MEKIDISDLVCDCSWERLEELAQELIDSLAQMTASIALRAAELADRRESEK